MSAGVRECWIVVRAIGIVVGAAVAAGLVLSACSGAQSGDRCDRGGKVFAAIARAVDVAGFACAALGGDSGKCLVASEAVEVARGAFGGVCALVVE